MQSPKTPQNKLPKSPDVPVNAKTSINCSKVPESLFDALTAKKHFSKFGKVLKIRLFPKRQSCIIEYEQPIAAERAVLNAGAYDGFMFEVSRVKPKIRRRSRREDDPDWVPDSDVEEELSAMSGAPIYRVTRQKPMDTSPVPEKTKIMKQKIRQSPVLKKTPLKVKPSISSQSQSGIESPVQVAVTQTTLSSSDAAAELYQLLSIVSVTPDEQWRTLDARDKILRSWGGAGARVKVGGATIGTCPDMCPEKERLHRQAEHQVMTLETIPDSDGQLEVFRAVKQYSRSSADQEIPMCYELRPASVLMRTCFYLLHEIADTDRQITLSDWFHFMWDRFRGIRKDITQQALCCADSIKLVEMCARFHAHCAARLADLEHTQFDQKLNTDNLTKCLQTLKHMYADVGPELKPNEAEFRGYIALLNLGDANFWWEIKQLPLKIQKSDAIIFTINIFNALDNNNYIRFFRLVKEKATYLQACILLRYFNDVRARGLARIVKAYAPRGSTRYPVNELMNALSFESVDNLKLFITHYGLRLARTDDIELTVILDRNQFIEDSDPYPTSRAIKLIETKRLNTVGELIAGEPLPKFDFDITNVYSSFKKDGTLKESALTAEDQGYNTLNDSNKDVRNLKSKIQVLLQLEKKKKITSKIGDTKEVAYKPLQSSIVPEGKNKMFSFTPAIQLKLVDIVNKSSESICKEDLRNKFLFSDPLITPASNLFTEKLPISQNEHDFKNTLQRKPLFRVPNCNEEVQYKFTDDTIKLNNVFGNKDTLNTTVSSIFTRATDVIDAKSKGNIFENSKNIFTKPTTTAADAKLATNIFGTFNNKNPFGNSAFSTNEGTSTANTIFSLNEDGAKSKLSPSTLFKSAFNKTNGPESAPYLIFKSKNKSSVANNIFNSVTSNQDSYAFDQNNELLNLQRIHEEREKQETHKLEEERKRLEEELRREEERLEEERLREERKQREKEEQRLKLEEMKKQEERRKLEEKKQEELKKRLEEERKAELKKKAEEEQKKYQERVEKESLELTQEISLEIEEETIREEMKHELDYYTNLVSHAKDVNDEILNELCHEISLSEMKAEIFLTSKLMRRWFNLWRKQYVRNVKRRNLLANTPVWLTEPPIETAHKLRRFIENAALKNMNAIHRGYKFTGELKQTPSPEPYNIMEIIKTPLLKRMKQINYPYDKCFFWKVTLAAPGSEWLNKKVNLDKWLLDAFSDKQKHDASGSLIHVQKHSWNGLMDFATSISIINKNIDNNCSEAVEGTNGLLFFTNENESNLIQRIDNTIKCKYPYQLIPVAIIMPQLPSATISNLEKCLHQYLNNNVISAFRIFTIDSNKIFDSLYISTKRALRWLAKYYPIPPPLEIDRLKSLCQRYLANEIWCKLKLEGDNRMNIILKNFSKLIQCYNTAVGKLTSVITNEDLFNYQSFPLEFHQYLDINSPYPKPYEFIPSSVKNSANISAIKDIMAQLKLPDPESKFQPLSLDGMQEQIREYCNQIEWFENAEDVVCKVVAVLPSDLFNNSCQQQFRHCYEQFNFVDFLNILIYEKINRLNNFQNLYAIYERSVLEEYRGIHWLFDTEVLSNIKHKAIDYEDDLDLFLDAKRRKLDMASMDYLELDQTDCTLVENHVNETDNNISKYNDCENAVKQLEEIIEEERKKSMQLENLLRSALSEA